MEILRPLVTFLVNNAGWICLALAVIFILVVIYACCHVAGDNDDFEYYGMRYLEDYGEKRY